MEWEMIVYIINFFFIKKKKFQKEVDELRQLDRLCGREVNTESPKLCAQERVSSVLVLDLRFFGSFVLPLNLRFAQVRKRNCGFPHSKILSLVHLSIIHSP